MKTLYPDAKIIKDNFSFLEDFGFNVIKLESSKWGSDVVFKGNGIKIELSFDFRDYFFFFLLYKSDRLQYSDESVGKDIIPFGSLDSSYNYEELQPNKKNGYERALRNNSNLLKKYLKNKKII